jgi:hypothetical protein
MLQTRDWHGVVICALVDKDRRVSSRSRSVRPVANIARKLYGPSRLEVGPVQEANTNAVHANELFQLQLPATNTVSIPVAQPQSFSTDHPRSRRHALRRTG